MNNRGVSYGGGQSSLGYLFGTEKEKKSGEPPPSPLKVNVKPPYGIDREEETLPSNSPEKQNTTNNSPHRPQGQNSGTSITDRPSTKVKSVPGGSSSLGYLFGDQ